MFFNFNYSLTINVYDVKMKKKNGFTLIELSIVLVIIGLIVGGVLVGQDLIEAAKIRSKLSKFQQIETVYNTFRTKYNCMAGDCKNANALGLGPDGNGNRRLFDGGTGDCIFYNNAGIQPRAQDRECQAFWVHLSSAGLIEETGLTDLMAADLDVIGDELAPYYPKLEKGYLGIVEYQGTLYIRTGLNGLVSNSYRYILFNAPEFNGRQMQQIVNKYEIDYFCDSNTHDPQACEEAFTKKVIPVGTSRAPYNTESKSWFYGLRGGVGAEDCYNSGQWKLDGPCNLAYKIN